MVIGWSIQYKKIIAEFGYNERLDYEASIILDSMVNMSYDILVPLLKHKTVLVVGAGPSLVTAIPILKKCKTSTIIAADSAAKPLIDAGIIPNIIVTDLDGNTDSLKRCNELKSIFVVHAHGDNIPTLHLAANFDNCIGSTQSIPYKKVQNFGGFTDGDRAVFLASHFQARKIILFGMDYEGKVGKFSNTKKSDLKLKLKKLEKSKELLTWLSNKTKSELFTTSSYIDGFHKISYSDCLECIL